MAVLLSSRIKLVLGIWFVAEILAFSLVAEWIGVPRTILLGVISSLLGLILLRRAGTSALMKLRANVDGRPLGSGDRGHFLDEILATGGALALLLPGFLSDIVGLALALPALRVRAARWIGGRSFASVVMGSGMGSGKGAGVGSGSGHQPRHGPATIDLDPEEWRRGEGSKPSP